MRFFFKAFGGGGKHLSGGGMRPNCSQSLLILPVQSPHRAEGGGRGCRGWEGVQTPSFDLLSALMSFESWLVFIKPVRSAVHGHSLTNYEPPMVSLLDILYIFRLLMVQFFPIRRPLLRCN